MIKNNQTQTIVFRKKPKIIGYYSVVGPKEKNGFFGPYFDYALFGKARRTRPKKRNHRAFAPRGAQRTDFFGKTVKKC